MDSTSENTVMADGEAAGQLANLHLDEPTGEMVR